MLVVWLLLAWVLLSIPVSLALGAAIRGPRSASLAVAGGRLAR